MSFHWTSIVLLCLAGFALASTDNQVDVVTTEYPDVVNTEYPEPTRGPNESKVSSICVDNQIGMWARLPVQWCRLFENQINDSNFSIILSSGSQILYSLIQATANDQPRKLPSKFSIKVTFLGDLPNGFMTQVTGILQCPLLPDGPQRWRVLKNKCFKFGMVMADQDESFYFEVLKTGVFTFSSHFNVLTVESPHNLSELLFKVKELKSYK